MHTDTSRILAINPGTRFLGVAVLQEEELLYYAVKTVKGAKTPLEVLQKIAVIIKQYIEDYQPSVLSIEQMLPTQKSASLLVVAAEEIKATAKAEGLAIFQCEPTAARQHICKIGKATKQRAARAIAEKYVELRRYLEGRTKWEALYYARMFDAIAVGLYCVDKIMKPEHDFK
jgi:Holliday junction resolvasome RuvABC endonuclease subunit